MSISRKAKKYLYIFRTYIGVLKSVECKFYSTCSSILHEKFNQKKNNIISLKTSFSKKMSLKTNHPFHILKFTVNTYHSFKNEALNEKDAIPLFDLFSYMQSSPGLFKHPIYYRKIRLSES